MSIWRGFQIAKPEVHSSLNSWGIAVYVKTTFTSISRSHNKNIYASLYHLNELWCMFQDIQYFVHMLKIKWCTRLLRFWVFPFDLVSEVTLWDDFWIFQHVLLRAMTGKNVSSLSIRHNTYIHRLHRRIHTRTMTWLRFALSGERVKSLCSPTLVSLYYSDDTVLIQTNKKSLKLIVLNLHRG